MAFGIADVGAAVLAFGQTRRDFGITAGAVDGPFGDLAIGDPVCQVYLLDLGHELVGGDPLFFHQSPHASQDEGQLVDTLAEVLDTVGVPRTQSDGGISRQ